MPGKQLDLSSLPDITLTPVQQFQLAGFFQEQKRLEDELYEVIAMPHRRKLEAIRKRRYAVMSILDLPDAVYTPRRR
jgi:hypothetical protein